MSGVRLVTYAFLTHRSPRRYSVDLRHVARLADGREVLLLDNRGFSRALGFAADSGEELDLMLREAEAIGDALSYDATREDLESAARMCVGPDEPRPDGNWEEAEHAHYVWLADVLRAAGVAISVEDVGRLPHDVVLDDALREATQPR